MLGCFTKRVHTGLYLNYEQSPRAGFIQRRSASTEYHVNVRTYILVSKSSSEERVKKRRMSTQQAGMETSRLTEPIWTEHHWYTEPLTEKSKCRSRIKKAQQRCQNSELIHSWHQTEQIYTPEIIHLKINEIKNNWNVVIIKRIKNIVLLNNFVEQLTLTKKKKNVSFLGSLATIAAGPKSG